MTIMTPGKFEGQPEYVPVFWDRALEGFADEDRDGTYVFRINPKDHEEFPELPVGARLYLVESDDGFVHSRIVTPSSIVELETKLVKVVRALKARGVKFDDEYIRHLKEEAERECSDP